MRTHFQQWFQQLLCNNKHANMTEMQLYLVARVFKNIRNKGHPDLEEFVDHTKCYRM